MKTCDYCGHESADEVPQCPGCGTRFEVDITPHQGFLETLRQAMSARVKWTLWLAAWGGVLIWTLLTNPTSLFSALYFPLGLIAILPQGVGKAIVSWKFSWMFVLPALAGWMFYALLAAAITFTKRNWACIVLYLILCVTLALNVIGCQETMHALEGIH